MKKAVAVAMVSGVLTAGLSPLAVAEPLAQVRVSDGAGHEASVSVGSTRDGRAVGNGKQRPEAAPESDQGKFLKTLRGIVVVPDGVYGFTINNSKEVVSQLRIYDMPMRRQDGSYERNNPQDFTARSGDKGLWGKDIDAVPDTNGVQINSVTRPTYGDWMKTEHEFWNKVRDAAVKRLHDGKTPGEERGWLEETAKKVDAHNAAWGAMKQALGKDPNAAEFRDMYASLIRDREDMKDRAGKLMGGPVGAVVRVIAGAHKAPEKVTVPGRTVTEGYLTALTNQDLKGGGAELRTTVVVDGKESRGENDDESGYPLVVYNPYHQQKGDLDADYPEEVGPRAPAHAEKDQGVPTREMPGR